LRLIINSVKFYKKKGENESEINERKDGKEGRKEGKTRYKERRVIKEKENARICLLYIPCLHYG
jgi:hypothetical protein